MSKVRFILANPVRKFGRSLLSNGVKLFVGFIFAQMDSYLKAKNLLIKRFGLCDFESATFPFIHTDYYEQEFGRNLKRRFIGFKRQILPQDLVRIKRLSRKIEKRLSESGRRTVNIDPGYVSLSKVVLATTKDYKHRIYLNKGIYAEITLFFQNKTFQAWPWTYPDYKTPEYIRIFNQIREIYRCTLLT
ncbi:MAG: DUF4416 family protein [Candidatus Omnitrophica bacterium]|nr:DUF4416 family protein [Candidatus Omnitrophota bacterium]